MEVGVDAAQFDFVQADFLDLVDEFRIGFGVAEAPALHAEVESFAHR